jgi:poly(3-hydroxybutyrate) depolymerase
MRSCLKTILIVFVLCLPFHPLPAQEHFIRHNGFIRAYLLYVPSTYDGSSPYPLILVLHGAGGSDSALYKSGFNERSEIMKTIMVYPSAINKYWNGPDNDVDFISALIDTLEDKFNIDSKRVYATGHSMGAFLCYQLAVELPGKIAAIAPVEGYSTAGAQTLKSPMPILAIHAVDDPTVSYSADQAGLGAWRKANRCADTPDTVYNHDGAIGQWWTAKETGADVSFYTYLHGGHTWLNYPIGCTDLIVDFFNRHPKRGMNVTLTSPIDVIFDAPAYIELSTHVESDIPVTRVEFYAGSNKIGEASAPPYSIVWQDAAPNEYLIHAKAVLADGTGVISSNIRQIDVLLPDIAAHKPSECSTSEGGSNAAPYAFDGDFTTRWSSSRSDLQWISVDLQEIYRIRGVTLFWGTSYGLGYSIDVSSDKINWTPVYGTTSGKGGAESISIPPIEARHVRMFGNKRGTPYSYSLWEFRIHGERKTGVKPALEREHPPAFALSRNYPNPFNPSTTIRYQLSAAGSVSLKVFDMNGREIAELVNAWKPAGTYRVEWKAAGLPSSVYFYRLQAGDCISTQKLILLR